MSRTSEPMPTHAARPDEPTEAPSLRPMRPVRLDALAVQIGSTTSQAVKKWLERRGLPFWLDGGRLWTDRALVDEHFAQVASASMAAKQPSARPAPAAPMSDDALLSTIKKKRGR